ncbi:MAG: 50S ribosomal protein L13 [Candidatus Levybacteria bacterium RIFCSPHIGHO2_01_FULL_37_17]|nr:MAG: 50S ribosomal protein L13 [Candidatus Levybacteria bacterium RIFCSPHIGHO2_01_FULL_37_17]OGH37095.1 MAG: 50S ribosomal protein L13 [Candidatus Levybacteria bacterium RIFCSPLOWO2_01_FULL_38_23]
MKQTKPTKASEIKREWRLIDLEGKVLGRIATDIAKLLMGKHKPNFVRNLDMGDNVVVINAGKIKVTGNKENLKTYYRHSGYPGGFKAETLSKLRQRKPQDIIIRAVSGMLPQNRLKDRMLLRLHVFAEADHTYQDKFKAQSPELKTK